MAFIADAALDAALAVIADCDALYLCTQEPTTFTEASSTYDCGIKTGPSIGAPANRTPNGRKVTVAAITDGDVTAVETATHWALTKSTGSLLRATGALSAGQLLVHVDNTFTLTAFDIGIPDAA